MSVLLDPSVILGLAAYFSPMLCSGEATSLHAWVNAVCLVGELPHRPGVCCGILGAYCDNLGHQVLFSLSNKLEAVPLVTVCCNVTVVRIRRMVLVADSC
jgi:hypothetical protein